MTTTYDPKHPKYLDEADVRNELTRVFDLCHGCRLCFRFCSSFPSLFEMIDEHDDHDAGRLTPFQQDRVVDECFQCKLCYVNCPYTPELHEWQLDFPRLMLRAEAMRYATGQKPVRQRATTQMLSRTDLLGKAAIVAAPVANKVFGAPEGSIVRRRSPPSPVSRPCVCCLRMPSSASRPGSSSAPARSPPSGRAR